jgi:hypothetical protein
MKNIFTFLIIPLVFASCAARGSEDGGWEGRSKDYKGSVYLQTESLAFYPQEADSPALEFSVTLLESDGNLQTLLRDTLYEGLSSEDYAASRWESLKGRYIDQAGGEYRDSLNWIYNEVGFGHFYSDFAIVKRVRDEYTGGAHGMNEINYFVFDAAGANRVLLNDIIEPGSIPELTKLVQDTLLADYAVKTSTPATSLSDIGFFNDHVDLTYDNFYLDKNGLGLVWNPFSIAPYFMGLIEVKLPYKSVKTMLNDRGKEIYAKL